MLTSVTGKERWLITKSQLVTWLDGICDARTLIAPQMIGEILLYRTVKNISDIFYLGNHSEITQIKNPVLSIKEIYFPPSERLFTIKKTGQEIQIEETFPEWETIVFGVRPCDARGVKLLDAVFLDTNPIDSFYARRRENSTIIGLACQAPVSTCFCTSVGGSPDDAHDVDIMLYPKDESYIAEAVTEKGRFLIPGGEWKETTDNPKKINLEIQFPIPEKGKWRDHFNDKLWLKLSERCLSCRACTYVCPTCRCFSVRDEKLAKGIFERIRCWDACTGENFRRIAGGHQPRPESSERLRNRFYCKFHYYPQQYGLGSGSACTGCGRCIDVCPVGVDITEALMNLENQA